MSVGISNANPAYSLQSVLSAQLAEFNDISQATNQLSSGKRITSAAVDPSGLAIYNNLSQQAQGADTANQNISDAIDAANVAQGATQTIQDNLNSINNLAIEANNGFNSASDNAALNAQAQAQVQSINQIASETNFNGTQLLNGSVSGYQPAQAAQAAVPTNTQTGSGSTVIASVSPSASTTSGTFNVTVDNAGNADVTFQDSTTQTTTNVGSFAAGSSTTFNGTTLNFGNFSGSDAGATATVQTTAATSASTSPTASVQSGPNAGQTTQVSFGNASTTGLGISNIDLSTPQSATNSQGQVAQAQTSLNLTNADLGAQESSLNAAFQNNNTLSNNLTAAASAIGDANQGQLSTDVSSNSIQQQITISVLNQANNSAGHLSAFLSQYA